MRSIAMGLVMLLAGLQYKLWVGDGGVLQWRHLEQKIELQHTENQHVLAKNNALEADIAELKRGEQALEEQARFELGMVKSGETYYQTID